jgi:O-antigen ligase
VAAAGLLLRDRVALGRLEVVALGAAAALTAWIACSLAWTASVPLTALELQHSLVPLTGLAAALALPAAWALGLPAGVATAAFAVSAWNLAAGGDTPLGYANAVALVAVLGTLLVAGWALERRGVLALLALPVLLVLLAVVVRSEARAAWLALAGGVAAAVALRMPRPGIVFAGVLAASAVALGVIGMLESEPRAAYWPATLAEAGREPLLGSGAGTWQRAWLEHRDEPFSARDAHSLYLETLAELGPLGLAIVLAMLAAPLVAAVRARGQPLVRVAAGAYAAFVLHLGVDWAWELTAVALAEVFLGAALLAAARKAPSGTETLSLVPRRAALVALTGVAVLALGGLAGNVFVARADERLGAGDLTGAGSAARRAARLAPWASEPWRLRGEAQLAQGRRADAAESFREGLERDGGDVELWRALSRATTGDELRRARARAAQLDPLGG